MPFGISCRYGWFVRTSDICLFFILFYFLSTFDIWFLSGFLCPFHNYVNLRWIPVQLSYINVVGTQDEMVGMLVVWIWCIICNQNCLILACGWDLEWVVFDHALYRLLIFTVCFEVYKFCILHLLFIFCWSAADRVGRLRTKFNLNRVLRTSLFNLYIHHCSETLV